MYNKYLNFFLCKLYTKILKKLKINKISIIEKNFLVYMDKGFASIFFPQNNLSLYNLEQGLNFYEKNYFSDLSMTY